MKIAMFTNTYLPHVGGVAKSVKTLEDACRKLGHEVLVIAPESEGSEESPHVLRVPAIQHFNGSDFSVQLPVPNLIGDRLESFKPDLIHSHHPFLLGDSALREAWKQCVPIVFTHHTLYERYTHYVPLDSAALKRVAVQLATGYCNLCDLVIAPSESVEHLLLDRAVTRPIAVVPTGIDTRSFAEGDGTAFRDRHGIPAEAPLLGHVGRLAKEKNLMFMAEAVADFMNQSADAVFVIVGEGEALDEMMAVLSQQVADDRIFAVGKLQGRDLADAYAALDCFTFTSQSETQGMVLAEAMAAATPVVALDGPGVRDIMRDQVNGILLAADASPKDYSSALFRMMCDRDLMTHCTRGATETARDYDTAVCVRKVMDCYHQLRESYRFAEPTVPASWDRFIAGLEIEWDLLSAKLSAAAAAVIETPATEAGLD